MTAKDREEGRLVEEIGRLEAEVARLEAERDGLMALCINVPDYSDGTEAWAWVGNWRTTPFVVLAKAGSRREAEALVRRAAGLGPGPREGRDGQG